MKTSENGRKENNLVKYNISANWKSPFTCSNCDYEFVDISRKPYILRKCRHMLCESCVFSGRNPSVVCKCGNTQICTELEINFFLYGKLSFKKRGEIEIESELKKRTNSLQSKYPSKVCHECGKEETYFFDEMRLVNYCFNCFSAIQDSAKILFNNRKETLFLKEKTKFCALVFEVHQSFGIEYESIDFERGLDAVRALMDVNYTIPLLLSCSQLFADIKDLCNYVGNKSKWNISSTERKKFDMNAKLVRDEAEKLYEKCVWVFKDLLPKKKLFWDEFLDCAQMFNGLSKDERRNGFDVPASILKFYEDKKSESETN